MNRVLNANFTYILLLVLVSLGAVGSLIMYVDKAYGKQEQQKEMTQADYKKYAPVFIISLVIFLIIQIVLINLMFPKKK